MKGKKEIEGAGILKNEKTEMTRMEERLTWRRSAENNNGKGAWKERGENEVR